MKYTFIAFFLLFSFYILQAYNISGTVKDKKGNSIPGVSIIYQGNQTGTVSDSEGFYSLSLLNGRQFLVFTFVGYKKAVIEIFGSGLPIKKDIVLEEDIVSLEEVAVVGKSKNQQKREQPNTITILDMNKLEGRSLSFGDVLNQASGVKVLQKGGLGSSSRTFIQGLDGKGVSIFVNGIPMGSSEEFQANSISTDMIKNIEIYKGIVPTN